VSGERACRQRWALFLAIDLSDECGHRRIDFPNYSINLNRSLKTGAYQVTLVNGSVIKVRVEQSCQEHEIRERLEIRIQELGCDWKKDVEGWEYAKDQSETVGIPNHTECCPRCEFPSFDCLCHPQFMS
jgi:hypothetical protein